MLKLLKNFIDNLHYRYLYKRAKVIYDSLGKNDKEFISPIGEYEYSEKILFRYLLREDKNDIGFIDIDQFEDEFLVSLAILPQYRGKGYSTYLLDKAVNFAKTHNIKKLIYYTLFNNKASIKIAIKYGFKLMNIEKDYYGFYLNI